MIAFQYISDIHLEFIHEKAMKSLLRNIIPKESICILAGDIGNPYSILFY